MNLPPAPSHRTGRGYRARRRIRVALPVLAVAGAAGAVVATGATAAAGHGATRHAAGADAVMEYTSADHGSSYDSWGYTDPQTGARYLSSVGTLADGTQYYSETQDGTPSDGGLQYRNVFVDPIQRVYTVNDSHTSTGPASPTPPAVRQLQRVCESGRGETVTVNGVTLLQASSTESGSTSTLDVDPGSDAPVRFTWSSGADTDAINWLPATAANIASAEAAPATTGDTQVSPTRFNAAAARNSGRLQDAR